VADEDKTKIDPAKPEQAKLPEKKSRNPFADKLRAE
jgi:hypothetical protein